MSSYYTYVHRPGYGRDDHMAPEILARAAAILGLQGADHAVAQALGLEGHACPLGIPEIRISSGQGVRGRMAAALRQARRDSPRRDCLIEIVRT
jgi:hypothetical protein